MPSQQPNQHWTVRTVLIFTGSVALIANLIAIIVFFSGKTSVQSFTSDANLTPTFQTFTTIATYPQLKSHYAGTYYPGQVNITLTAITEDQQGNFNLVEKETGSSVQLFCTGNVTIDNQITLHCSWLAVTGETCTSTGQGTLFPDEHIEIRVLSDCANGEYWNVS